MTDEPEFLLRELDGGGTEPSCHRSSRLKGPSEQFLLDYFSEDERPQTARQLSR